MNITVAICTWNRADLLDQTLAQMHHLVVPQGVDWELLVVNNNCTDHTDEVLARHAAALPIRRLFEPKQGHSNARNCAIEAAQGELMIWTDDDVLVQENWIACYVKAANEFSDAAYFGGPVEPWFESAPPKWIERNLSALSGPLVIIAPDRSETYQLPPGVAPTGANMAFRTTLLKQFRFSPLVGRVGDDLISADEKELCERLAVNGHRGVWIGSVKIKHFVPSQRMTREYLWRWFHGSGRTEVRRGKVIQGASFARAPRWIWRKYLEETIKRIIFAPIPSQRWFQSFRNTAVLRGMLDEFRKKGLSCNESPISAT